MPDDDCFICEGTKVLGSSFGPDLHGSACYYCQSLQFKHRPKPKTRWQRIKAALERLPLWVHLLVVLVAVVAWVAHMARSGSYWHGAAGFVFGGLVASFGVWRRAKKARAG